MLQLCGSRNARRYCKCGTDSQALDQRRTWFDGTNRTRPGLRDARAACQSGDTLVVTTDWRGSVAPRPFCSRNNASAAAYDFEYGRAPLANGGTSDPVGI
jgi:hypothetical protein